VREVIPYLSYDFLVEGGIIPRMGEMSPPGLYTTKPHHPSIHPKKKKDEEDDGLSCCEKEEKPNNYSCFGMFVEFVVKDMLSFHFPLYDNGNLYKKDWMKNIDSSMVEAQKLYPCKLPKGSTYITYLASVEKALHQQMPPCKKILYNHVLSAQLDNIMTIQGHPDLVSIIDDGKVSEKMYISDDKSSGSKICIFDVKTFARFQAESKDSESFLQILTYFCLAKHAGQNVTHVGLILPLQRKVAVYDLSTWDRWFEYLQLINKCILQISLLNTRMMMSPYLGTHARKRKTVYETFKAWHEDMGQKPLQMFLSSGRSGKTSAVKDDDIAKANEYLVKNNLQYYTHSPYTINLCKNGFGTKILSRELEMTRALGGKGVVVHVGKFLKEDKVSSIVKMKDNIKKVLPFASVECPLLLETPAGQGTELLTDVDEFIDFFLSFSEKERKKFKACIDTCHIFATGYRPTEYLNYFVDKLGLEMIGLIHYNDAQVARGSEVDRHQRPGIGQIGVEEMLSIFSWCDERRLPMILE
jgi:deoxyribonuclease-4